MMPNPFLQINRLRHDNLDAATNLIRHCVDVAVERCKDVGLQDVEWDLWRPEGPHPDHLWLTEGYGSAQQWGQAEDVGITDPDLRAAIAQMNAAKVRIDRVLLLAQMDVSGNVGDGGGQLVRIHVEGTPTPGTPTSLFYSAAERTKHLHGRVRLFKARVSGDLFNQVEIWVETGRDDKVWYTLRDSADVMGWKADRYFALYGDKSAGDDIETA